MLVKHLQDYLSDVAPHDSEHICACKQRRFFFYVDFNQRIYKDIKKPEEAKEKILTEICNAIDAFIIRERILTKNQEVYDFWNDSLFGSHPDLNSSPAFNLITRLMADKASDPNDFSSVGITDRLQIRKAVEVNIEIFYDYLLWFSRFIINKVYCGNRKCFVICIDNLDIADAIVQRAIVNAILFRTMHDYPTIVIPLRPETFDKHSPAAGIIERRTHKGPSVLRVVMDRIDRFVRNPLEYRRFEHLKTREFELVHSYLKEILERLRGVPRTPLAAMLDELSGEDIRMALILCQNFALVPPEVLRLKSMKFRDLIIALANGRNYSGQFNWKNCKYIENLFYLYDYEGNTNFHRYLIKLRILKYLLAQAEGRRRVEDLNQLAVFFKYADDMVRRAVNEMMVSRKQLIRSTGCDHYTYENWVTSAQDIIKITQKGRNYGSRLSGNADYIELVCKDATVDSAKFLAGYDNRVLLDRLRLLMHFLTMLVEIDHDEMKYALSDFEKERLFVESFGETILTWDVLSVAIGTIFKILNEKIAQSEDGSDYRAGLQHLLCDFRSLYIQTAYINERLLNVFPAGAAALLAELLQATQQDTSRIVNLNPIDPIVGRLLKLHKKELTFSA